jgi:hypothetical protein
LLTKHRDKETLSKKPSICQENQTTKVRPKKLVWP